MSCQVGTNSSHNSHRKKGNYTLQRIQIISLNPQQLEIVYQVVVNSLKITHLLPVKTADSSVAKQFILSQNS